MIPLSKPLIGDAEKQAVLAVLDSGMLAQGERVAALEAKWAAACGVRHAIATTNGTTALHCALLAHGIGPGDEVITSPFTFIASVNSILYAGAQPVFVDVAAETFNLDPALLDQQRQVIAVGRAAKAPRGLGGARAIHVSHPDQLGLVQIGDHPSMVIAHRPHANHRQPKTHSWLTALTIVSKSAWLSSGWTGSEITSRASCSATGMDTSPSPICTMCCCRCAGIG